MAAARRDPWVQWRDARASLGGPADPEAAAETIALMRYALGVANFGRKRFPATALLPLGEEAATGFKPESKIDSLVIEGSVPDVRSDDPAMQTEN